MHSAISSRIAGTIIFFVVCAVMAISGHESALASQVDEFYHTKESALAATTQEALNAATTFEEEGSKEKLAALMKRGLFCA